MKVYEAVFNEDAMEGVYALSVVENPAMEDLFIALSEEDKEAKVELAAIDEEKRLLLGAALIPDKKIYRNVDGHEFFITFSSDTIEKLAHSFSKNQHNNNSSLEHEVALNGMSVVENWIVEDSIKDKSSNYGKNYPVGTWVTMMKVDNDEIWGKVKNGEIKGFSIDALLGLAEVKFNTNTMTKQEFFKQLKEIFTFNEEPSKVEEVETAPVAEETVEEPAKEEEQSFDAEQFMNDLKETLGQFKSHVDEKINSFDAKLSKEVEEKEKEIEELKVELEKQPEVEAVKPNQQTEVFERVELTAQGRILEKLRNNK